MYKNFKWIIPIVDKWWKRLVVFRQKDIFKKALLFSQILLESVFGQKKLNCWNITYISTSIRSVGIPKNIYIKKYEKSSAQLFVKIKIFTREQMPLYNELSSQSNKKIFCLSESLIPNIIKIEIYFTCLLDRCHHPASDLQKTHCQLPHFQMVL